VRPKRAMLDKKFNTTAKAMDIKKDFCMCNSAFYFYKLRPDRDNNRNAIYPLLIDRLWK